MKTDAELTSLVALLFAGYPEIRPSLETLELYEQRLSRCDRSALKEAILWLVDNFPKVPHVSDVREKVSAIVKTRESKAGADALKEHERRWREEQTGKRSN